MTIKFGLTAFALMITVGSAHADPTSTSAAAHGRQLFMSDGCWECHGTIGQGGGLSGPRIAPMELPLDAVVQQLRTPRSQMPPFEEKVVSDADAADIYAYLKSIPSPKDAKDIPLLQNN